MPEQAPVRLVDAAGVVDPLVGGLGQAVDGHTVALGNEVLLISPPNGNAYAGPYVAATGAWPRRNDWASVVEMNPGDWWRVLEGVQYQGTAWAFENTSPPATIDVTPLTIGLWTRRREAEAGGGIDIAGTTPPIISWNAPSDVESTFIEGLRLEYLSANSLRVKTGATYIPQTGVADMPLDTDLENLVLTANSWYYLYGYDAGGGVLAIDPPSTQAPNTVPYRGEARSKGPDLEPELTRRSIGARRTGAAANTLRKWEQRGNTVLYLEDTAAAPYRVLDDGRASAYASVDCSALVPPTSKWAVLQFQVESGNNFELKNSEMAGRFLLVKNAAQNSFVMTFPLAADRTLQYRFPGGAPTVGNGLMIGVLGFVEER